MIFIETTIFTRLVQELLTDDEYRELQTALILQPGLGSLFQVAEDCEKFVGLMEERVNVAVYA